ncbi:transposase [Fusarium acutatum]|uniref:Transposase n=1 Tax=Fusarium acutatum TaxID=78861 RepID=A0A8H4JUX5_9HYPO|nr:transposase [Fusarium acutatum]
MSINQDESKIAGPESLCDVASSAYITKRTAPCLSLMTHVSPASLHGQKPTSSNTTGNISMAPNLAACQHALIHDMILAGYKNAVIAGTANCRASSVRRIRTNMRCYGSTKAPFNGIGRRRLLSPPMLTALLDRLAVQPNMYRDEMVEFLEQEFETTIPASNTGRALRSARWTRKTARRVAKGRNADLRDYYLYKLSFYRSYQLVYIDESGCDRRILPAYTQEGILHYDIFPGSTDSAKFEEFIEQLLHHCGKWLELNSVLVMDNASFYRSPVIEQICEDAGVKLLYLSPYSPDFNPIEEFFAELKSFIRRHWHENEHFIQIDFASYLEWCVNRVGSRQESAEGHFRHAGVEIEEPPERMLQADRM